MSVRYYPLINKFITAFHLSNREAMPSGQSVDKLFSKPFITIAREPGSGGKPIAQAVAKKLGFTFVDKQIVEEIAKSTRKRQALIRQIDEKDRSAMTDLVHSIFNQDYVDDLKYLTEMAKVVIAYASKGHVVILGRGGNFITPMAKGLHVRITAPYAIRLQRAVDYEGLSKIEARKIVSKIEKERQAFIKQYLRHDSKKANSYDLTINTTYFNVNQARDLIIEAFCQKFTRFERYSALFKEGFAR